MSRKKELDLLKKVMGDYSLLIIIGRRNQKNIFLKIKNFFKKMIEKKKEKKRLSENFGVAQKNILKFLEAAFRGAAD